MIHMTDSSCTNYHPLTKVFAILSRMFIETSFYDSVILIWFCHFLPLVIILVVGHMVIIIAFLKLLISQFTITNKVMQSHASNNDMLLSFR
jgi:hypothetical protein